MKRVLTVSFAFAALALAPMAARAATIEFHAALSGKSEVPPNTSPGKGEARISYNTATKKLTWDVTYSGLTGPAIGAHFHGPAGPGKSAPILVPLKGSLKSPMKGSATLTSSEVKDLMGGKLYFNIHTSAHKPGELRGQVEKGPSKKAG